MARIGLDWRPFANAHDQATRMFEVAVAEQAAHYIERDRRTERINLANEVGSVVGRHVGSALSALAQAMRPKR